MPDERGAVDTPSFLQRFEDDNESSSYIPDGSPLKATESCTQLLHLAFNG